MKNELTKEDILMLFAEQAKRQDKALEKQAKAFEELTRAQAEKHSAMLERQTAEFHQKVIESRAESEKEQKKRNREFDKKLGEITGTWGKFAEEMVAPRIAELFKEKGVPVEATIRGAIGMLAGQKYYEIDMLAINSHYAVAVEVKSSLSKEDVEEHLERLEKIRKVQPSHIQMSGVTLLGAVAGIVIEPGAARFAYKKGLFVIQQNGKMVDVANDGKFKPKEWKTEY